MSYGQDPWQPGERPRQQRPYDSPSRGYGAPWGQEQQQPYGGGGGWRPPRDDQYGDDRYQDPYEEPYRDPAEGERQRTRSRSGGRSQGPATGPGRRGSRGAGTGPGGGPEFGASPSGPANVNDDLDLDEIDPEGRAQRRAAKEAARLGNTKRRRALKYTAWGTAGAMVAVAGVGFFIVNHLLGNIQTVSLDSLKNRPAASSANAQGQTPLNILVLGSQTRDGQNLAVHIGDSSKAGTDLSDTAFVMHIAADRKWAEVVSIPRDLFVRIPACQDRLQPNQTDQAQSHGQFYDAMGEGGPACAVATVEQMTNIRMDHFVELTFNAFIQLTDAVGGVQVCVPPPGINDPNYSGLVLSAGLHTVTGNQALAFVRDRHGLAGGMDTQRIRMQQMFMTSLFNKMTSNGTLEDPVTLYKIANAVSTNITVDPQLDNIGTMASIAEGAGSIGKSYIQYITAPYALDAPGQYSYDPQGEHSSPAAGFQTLWTYLRNDQPLPGTPAAEKYGSSAAPSANSSQAPKPAVSPSPTVPLSSLSVEVFNGTSTSGEASHAAANLKAMGITTTIGYSGYSNYSTTTIYYPPGDQVQADSLANQVVGAKVEESSNVSQLALVLGTNAPSAIVDAPASSSGSGSGSGSSASTGAPSPSASISVEARTGDENICSNLPGVVGYGGHP